MIKLNSKYNILTPTGFKDFKGIQKLRKDKSFEFILADDTIIRSSESHKFISNGREISAKDLIEKSILDSKYDNKAIKKKKLISEQIFLYDILEVDGGNIFYADDIISHNCDASFLSSGATVIEPELLQYYLDNPEYNLDPLSVRGATEDLWIWKYADYSKSYLIAADVARGDGSDYSAFVIMDIDSLEIVAEYKGQIGTTEYGKLLYQIGLEYNSALVAVENTGVGWSTVQTLIDMGYPNLYYSFKNDPFLDEQIHLKKGVDLKDNSQKIPGISTSHVLRPVYVSKIMTYFREKAILFHSKRLMAEIRVFIWKNGRAEAQTGYNDDLVMALGMALYLRDTAIKLKQIGMDLTRKTMNGFKKHKLVQKSTGNKIDNPYTYRDSKGNSENLKWLL